MEAFNEIWNNLTRAANDACAIVNGAIDTAKIHMQICDRKTQIKLAYRTLGEYVYRDHATGSDSGEQCRTIIADIDRWQMEIEALERIYKQADAQTEPKNQTQEQTSTCNQAQQEEPGKEQTQQS